MVKNKLVQPFVKWVGGKRQLIKEMSKYIPEGNYKYYEPFVGGGAIFFDLQPKNAIINDYNSELINTYNVIKNNVEELIGYLKTYPNDEEFYYEMRESDRKKEYENWPETKKASRFIYLNKTCYNGLYRVNQAGYFNTPFGRYKNPNIVNDAVLKAVSEFLNGNNIVIKSDDYKEVLKGIKKNSFVYLDPPYDPISHSSNFTGYTTGGFGKDQQIELKEVCDELNKNKIKFLLSNSNTEFIRNLYDDYNIEIVNANRLINSAASKRGEVEEVLVRNYDINIYK
ncbi:DNA adenine methylase [Clostridium luticellarii]|uniref:DNA adenine methylase n=1 Tax=Clostridium luticellarii TaxID=1691940 RepID=UPI0023564703|nr:DNA adenine methylase [Clostridium luticellarii]MCI1946537.1 DNA adenine methylase [Clostridium luticellarii]MCI1996983.1 DNA adenine methylase [Clostridium luticellarii]